MSVALYQVVITGLAPKSQSPMQALNALASLFSISLEEAQARFGVIPCVARGHLTLEQAEKYCRVMTRQGIGCEIRREPVETTVSGIYPRLS